MATKEKTEETKTNVNEVRPEEENVTAPNAIEALDNAFASTASKQEKAIAKVREKFDPEVAFSKMSPEDQQKIIKLSDAIDLMETEKLMNYASEPLQKTISECGAFLKTKKGSQADQQVTQMVIELSQKCAKSDEDFQLALKQPNFFQRFWVKLFGDKVDDRAKKIRNSAVSSFTLLSELNKACDEWIKILVDSMTEASYAYLSDSENGIILQKYLIAGHYANKRFEQEISDAEAEYDSTGMIEYEDRLGALKDGYEIFASKMNNLYISLAMYMLSRHELQLIQRANRNVQIKVRNERDLTMSTMSMNLRNAVLNAENEIVMESQKSIKKLNDALVTTIAKNIGLTAQETERLICDPYLNVQATKEALNAVSDALDKIGTFTAEALPKMTADVAEIREYMEILEDNAHSRSPVGKEGFEKKDSKNNPSPSNKGDGELKF